MNSNVDITQQMQDLIKSIDFMNDELVNSASEILTDSAEIVASEQRRLISGKSSKLAGLIKVGKTVATKKGNANVLVGYDTEAIKEAPESVIMEFGKPGKESKGYVQKGKYKGRKIGKVNAINHIRKGFDNMKEKATEIATAKLDEVLKKW